MEKAGLPSVKRTSYGILIGLIAAITIWKAPLLGELRGTMALNAWCCVAAGLVTCAMEFAARAAHRDSWHAGRLWFIHRSHHKHKSEGDVFEHNDVFLLLTVILIIPLFAWSAVQPPSVFSFSLLGVCAGMSLYGTAYMLVHDGVHHQRFPVGPLARIPCVRRVSDAHASHHKGSMGPPYGFFLGEAELRAHKSGSPPKGMPLWMKAGLYSLALTTFVSGALSW